MSDGRLFHCSAEKTGEVWRVQIFSAPPLFHHLADLGALVMDDDDFNTFRDTFKGPLVRWAIAASKDEGQ